jgi:hypothetical protein
MVQNSGKTLCASAFKPVNLPEPVDVEEASGDLPSAVIGTRKQVIAAIDDRWRIDDEWWRSEPISRIYYSIIFASGQRLVIYKDLINSHWYRQAY